MTTSSYIFDGPDPDVILRASLQPGSDEFKDFHVHKVILSIASITFRDTFSIPQPPRHASESTTLDVVPLSESADVLETFLRLIYPVDPPVIENLWLLDDLFRIADKYIAKGITAKLGKRLISPSFLQHDPIGVFAIACRSNLDEEARLAVPHTFSIDVTNRIPEGRLQAMTAQTYHRLLTEHGLRRKQIIDILDAARLSIDSHSQCQCLERLKEETRSHISGSPHLDRKTLQTSLSLVGSMGPSCRGMVWSNCITSAGFSKFVSDVMRRIQAL